MKTILFQGDSITDGEHDNGNARNPGYCYPLFVKSYLDCNYPEEYQVLNRAIAGNQVVDLYARMMRDIVALKPDVLSILIGVNDVLGWLKEQKTSPDEDIFYRTYCQLIEDTRKYLPNVKIMILEPFIASGMPEPEKRGNFTNLANRYAGLARDIAAKYDLVFVPLQERFNQALQTAPADYWIYDDVHPTVEGTALIAEAWMAAFREMGM